MNLETELKKILKQHLHGIKKQQIIHWLVKMPNSKNLIYTVHHYYPVLLLFYTMQMLFQYLFQLHFHFHSKHLYYYGNGIEKDYEEAVKWFRTAAEQGDSEAQYKLGICYYYGYGIASLFPCSAAILNHFTASS